MFVGSIVGDYKLLLGPQQFSFWQGPSFPVRRKPVISPLLVVAISRNNALAWQNGSDSEPYGQWPPYNMADCGKGQFPGNGNGGVMSGGCLFNL